MYKKRNIVFAVSGIMLLLLAGCDNEDAKPKDTASVSASVQTGNWQVKPGNYLPSMLTILRQIWRY